MMGTRKDFKRAQSTELILVSVFCIRHKVIVKFSFFTKCLFEYRKTTILKYKFFQSIFMFLKQTRIKWVFLVRVPTYIPHIELYNVYNIIIPMGFSEKI